MVTAAAALMLFCSAPLVVEVPALAQPAYKAPRTVDGTPDLQGIWQVRNTSAAFDLEDHAGALGIPARKKRDRGSPRRQNSVSVGSAGETAGELQESRGRRHLEQMLYAGRAANHLSRFSISDFPNAKVHADRLRIHSHLSNHLYGCQASISTASIFGWAIRAGIGMATRW